ncbi:unnamed protein product, partial [Leptidea sinapis]
MNINIVSEKLNIKFSEYMDLLASYGLLDTHTFPTRESNCLDHCFVKSKLKTSTVVCHTTLTDQFSVMLSLPLKITSRTRINSTFSKTDHEAAIIPSELLCSNSNSQAALHNINKYFVNVGTNLAISILLRKHTNELELFKKSRQNTTSGPLNSFMLLPTDEME